MITRLQLDGTVYWLDPTLQKQGRRLDTRGHPSYGAVLVVAPQTQALARVEPPAGAPDGMEFEQTWDLSDLTRAAQFTSIVRVRGMAAEAWRNAVAAGGSERIAENMAGAWARMMPGLKATAAPVVRDDRETNQFEFELRYELPNVGNYERGTLTFEAPALEMIDAMVGPREARRDMPWQYDPPRQMRQRVQVIAPRRFQSRPPAPQEVNDKHFSLTSRMEVSGNTFTLLLGYTRKLDEVLPGDLAGYREHVQTARRLSGTTLRLPLLDADRLQGVFADIERRTQRQYGSTSDALRELVVRQELEVALATEVLKVAGDASPLAGPVLAKRAAANNMLNRFDATLADVDRALPLNAQASELLYARGLALLSLGRADEAAAAMRSAKEPGARQLRHQGPGQRAVLPGPLRRGRSVIPRGRPRIHRRRPRLRADLAVPVRAAQWRQRPRRDRTVRRPDRQRALARCGGALSGRTRVARRSAALGAQRQADGAAQSVRSLVLRRPAVAADRRLRGRDAACSSARSRSARCRIASMRFAQIELKRVSGR